MSTLKYVGRVDPIQILRNSIVSNKKVKLKGKYLQFDKDIKLSLKTPTAWLSPITNKQYTLGAIWLYLELKDNSEQYFPKATELEIDTIGIADKEEILKYFTGKIPQTNCINQELKIQLLTTKKRDEPNGGFQGEGESKKRQSTMPFELRVIDHVMRFEHPTGSKTRSLRCPTQSFHFFLDLLRQKSEAKNQTQGKSRLARIFQKKKYPIIIVPELIQAGNVSLGNIEKLLIQGQYEEPKLLTNSIQRKIQLETTLRGKKIVFQVTNNPSLLTLSEWQNVVAVFVLGQKSQFSTWSIRDPSEIFKKTRGFLLKYSNISAKNEVNDWNVKTFIIQRNARYRDQEIQKKLLSQIEDYLFQKI